MGISVRAASRKYGVPATTISGWIADGLVPVVTARALRGQRLTIDEAVIARLATYPRRRGPRPVMFTAQIAP